MRFLLLLAVLLVGCQEARAPSKFSRGEIVEFVVSGQRGQIISVYTQCEPSCYKVRVFSPQSYTNTHILSADVPIQTFHIAVINGVREFELRPSKP